MTKNLNSLRIIAGHLRRRKVTFSPFVQLRPTGERVRETLFNWLQQNLQGKEVLDLFSGSGILGFESISRGAKYCTFIDINSKAILAINNNIDDLSIQDECTTIKADIPYLLTNKKINIKQYDVIYLDPPFEQKSQMSVLKLLNQDVRTGTLVYIESDQKEKLDSTLELQWTVIKEKVIGKVYLLLLKKL